MLKNRIFRRTCRVVLAAAVLTAALCSAGPLSALADSSTIITDSATGLEFDPATGFITGYTGSASALTVPSAIDGVAVVGIGSSAFVNNESNSAITSVTLPDGIKYIGFGAFSGCDKLASINLPDSIVSIGVEAFEGSGLDSVTLPKGLKNVAEETFASCASLKSVSIPVGVASIGEGAFEMCTSLASAEIPASVTDIGSAAFAGCTSLAAINVDTGNPSFSSQTGVLFDKTGTELLICPGGKSGDYDIPAAVRRIESWAFYGCAQLTAVTIPDGVAGIGVFTFSECPQLTQISIPESVTGIDDTAFLDDTGFSINGYTGSYAQTFAGNNGAPFVSTDSIPVRSSVAAGSTAALSHEFDTNGASWKSSDASVVSVQSQSTDTSNPSKTIYNATIQGVKPGTATVALVDASGNTVYSHIVTVSPTDPLYVSLTGAKFIGAVSDGSADSRYPTPVTVELPSTATSLKASDILASNNDTVALYSSADYSSAGLVGDGGAALSGNTSTLYLTATNGLNGTVKYYKLTVDLVGSSSYKLTAPAVFTKTGTNYTATVTVDRAQAEKLSDPKLYVVYTIANNGKQFQTYQCIDISSSDTTTTKDIVVGAGFVKATTFLVNGTVDWSQGFPSMKSNVLTIAMPS